MRKTLLCIEDDRETAALIAEEFDERGFDVRQAYDGEAGFSAILELRPAAVLCDIMMPTSGFEVLIRLNERAPALRRGIPFIFVSAFDDHDFQREARRLGADDYVVKPIDFDLLSLILNRHLSGVDAAVDMEATRKKSLGACLGLSASESRD
jgi:DNA-binding response OmpR family regulator